MPSKSRKEKTREKPFQVLSPLHKASRQVQIYMEARCRRWGVRTVEAHLLGYCAAKGPCPISELKLVLGEKKSTLTAMLDRLEGRDLVRRTASESDRRSWVIATTKAGSALAESLRAEYSAFEAELLKRINARDLRGFAAVTGVIGEVTQVVVGGRR